MAKKTRRRTPSRKSPVKKRTTKKKRTKNVQQEVRELTLKAISERNLTLDQLSDLASAVIGSATTAMKSVLPASRKSALRQVIKGIDDAWAATAKASVSSLRHAQRYGLKFARRDLTQLGKRLGSLEQELVKTVDRHARRLGGELGRELKSVSGQIRKAGTQIRPAARAAQKAIVEQGPTLAREVASVGAKAGRQAVRGVLLTASGLLEGAGKAVRKTKGK